jgi:hypothetical protein
MSTFTCSYGRPGVPHSPHVWGRTNYCPGEWPVHDDGGYWLVLAGGLFFLALLISLCAGAA